jgi:peptide/nickel transport system substrate-binding protein
MPQGNDDATVASRQILTGSHMVNGDVVAPGNVLATATRRYKGQLVSVPAGGSHWVALNNAIPPFNDINVRKAVLAGFNRQAMLLTRGGRAVGDIPTHMIPPGVPGFDQAGGYKGPGLDFLAKPQGDMNLAAQYFKKAGFSSGKYEGKDTLLMVGTAGGVEEKAAEVAQQNLENMGFKVRLRLVTHDAMYTKYCNVPSQKVQVCPNVGWFKDFPDPQTILDPTFNGKNIIPSNNVNYSQLDVPAINKAMDRAELLTDANQRAQAWAQIDRMVTEQAPLVPWIWDKYPLIESKDVQGVPSQVNTSWDLAWTSLK